MSSRRQEQGLLFLPLKDYQGIPEDGRAKKEFYRVFRESVFLLIPSFQTSRLQNCEE